ncbi:hypothetical protein ACSSS7_002724 [Eimeria intestinalis]
MQSQAALFEDLVRHQISNNISIDSSPSSKPQLHLLGVGEGCAHAIIYASCYPRQVRSLVLIAPLLELREHPENGPLENHILKRIQVYRRLTSRLPTNAFFSPSLPPPKVSFLEFLSAGLSRIAPKTALSSLLQLTYPHKASDNNFLSSEQLLAALQQQQPLQQQLLLRPFSERSSKSYSCSPKNKALSWRMQQQQEWEQQQAVYRQLLLRLQHLTGSCCLQHRLLGFLEDALILTAHEGATNHEKHQPSNLLLDHLKQLQVPAGLIVLAPNSHPSLHASSQNFEKSRWDVLRLTENTSPKMLLLSHADRLNDELHNFYLRFK